MASKQAPRTPKATTRPKAKPRPLAAEPAKPGRFESFDALEELRQLHERLPTGDDGPDRDDAAEVAAGLAAWFTLAADLLANPSLPEAVRRELTRKVHGTYLGTLDQREQKLQRLLTLVAETAAMLRGDDADEGAARLHLMRFATEYPDETPWIEWDALGKAVTWWNAGAGYSSERRQENVSSKWELVEEAIRLTSFACDAETLRQRARPPRVR